MRKKEYLKFLIGTFVCLALTVLSNVKYATFNKYEDFRSIENMKKSTIFNEQEQSTPLLIKNDISGFNSFYSFEDSFAFRLKSSSLPIQYNLKDDIKVNLYDQGQTNNCWIYSINSVIETTMAKEKNKYVQYDITYTDEKSALLYNRKVNSGGNPILALSFYTSGYGPLNANTKKIDTQIKDFNLLSTIYKSKDSKGNIQYNWGDYTESEVDLIRNKIKSHIKSHGAVTAYIYTNEYLTNEYYSNPENYIYSEAYFCDYSYNKYINAIGANHQVTIIGWDDNYSKTNFNPNHQPKNDGAYIVLNSWGDKFSTDGCFYISYEDTFVESCVYGVYNVDEISYDTLYQHDELGMSNIVTFDTKVGQTNYGANIFTRDNSKSELLTEISVANMVKSSYEIYINPSNESLDFNNLIKVKTTEELSEGFHTIKLDNGILLTGGKFAVVVKYNNEINGLTYIGIENTGDLSKKDSPWLNAAINQKESYIYYETGTEKYWIDLKDLVNEVTASDFKQICNICIKAFTIELEKEPPTLDVLVDSSNSKMAMPIKINVQDEEGGSGIKNVTVNGKEITITNNEATYIARTNGSYTIIATDNAGNKTTKSIEISGITTILESGKYKINNEYVWNIPINTTKKAFFENLTTNIESKEIYDFNTIVQDEEILKTGMILKITEGEETLEYLLAVIGDSSGDGKITTLDLIDSVKQYKYEKTNGIKGKAISGANLLALKFTEDAKYTARDLIGEVKKYKEMKKN